MKLTIYLSVVIFLLTFSPLLSKADVGDTTTIQAFSFGSPLEARFLFPDSTHRWSKILMYYTLKCNPNQSPACGEWDYLTYTYLYRHTGIFDSILYSHPNFTFNGNTPDSLMFMNSPSYRYFPFFEYFNQTVPSDTALIGTGNALLSSVFYSPGKDSRTQCLWKKDELLAAGLKAGQITGLRFKFQSAGSGLKQLSIRIKSTLLDSLPGGIFQEGQFTEVYKRDHHFLSSGWQVIPLTLPFEWDGNSNIILDIGFANHENGIPNVLYADSSDFPSVVLSDSSDFFLKFQDMDYVTVPSSAFSTIDSSITVAFWQYGDSLLQPQNNTLFEGVDSVGARVVNVHLPWSDGNVYWDAGRDSQGYDRLDQHIDDPSLYRGKWNHWAFTKNVKTRKMKFYCNGQLRRISNGPKKRMNNIAEFRIGSNALGSDLFYDGFIDDFSIWDKELSDTAIRNIMYQDIRKTNPDYLHLKAYYRFNNGNGFLASDGGQENHTAELGGYPQWQDYQGKDRFRNVSPVSVRPMVIFEQGIYNPAVLDSVINVDTIVNQPIMIVLYSDTLQPYIPTDTLTCWNAYYNNYVFNSQGVPVDSTLVLPDQILYRKDNFYHGKPYEILERYELARYITPYGNSLSLGDGWTWIYDLTDYAPLLHDSVHLSSGNWQELLDMKFKLIEGIPPRDVLGVENVYTGTHGYADASQHNLPPVKLKTGKDVANARLKMRITGHGFGGSLDCSEFCPRTNQLYINGIKAYTHYVWRSCGINPLYPQGGTWLYDRAEWCPGAEVYTKDFELTPYIVPGDSMTIDYDLQAGYTWNGQGSWPYYQIEAQLITYSEPNFTLDAAMEEVIAPNDHQLYNRFNPICGKPLIAIKNNGKNELKSCEIKYGPIGGKMQVYQWTGSLAFQDTASIMLPTIDWSDWTAGDNRFIFTIDKPNGGLDQCPENNEMTSNFDIPPTYENILQFRFKSNHEASYLSWVLEDENANVLYHNGELEQNTVYIDTFRLSKGCYRLIVRNSLGEGLNYWANMPPYGNGTAGSAQIFNMQDESVKKFQGDFGSVISQSFTVGMTIDVPDLNPEGYFNVFPNPSDGKFTLSTILEQPEELAIIVNDGLGKEIFSQGFKSVRNMDIPLDLSGQKPGVYMMRIMTRKGMVIKKLIIQ